MGSGQPPERSSPVPSIEKEKASTSALSSATVELMFMILSKIASESSPHPSLLSCGGGEAEKVEDPHGRKGGCAQILSVFMVLAQLRP